MEEEVNKLAEEYKSSNSKNILEKINQFIEEKPLKDFNHILVNSSKPSKFLESILLGKKNLNFY